MKCENRIQPLRELADIQTGPFGSQLHKEDYVEIGTPIVTVEHLGNRTFTEQNLPKVSDNDKERLKKYILSTGDIVFSRVGSVDRCSYVDKRHNGWMFSGRCLRVRPTQDIDSLYLYYYFCLESTRQFVRNIAVGATMPSINTKLLGEVPINVPDMLAQKKISGILSSIDDKIELNNKINENLERQAQAIFKSWFLDYLPFYSIKPTSWKFSTLGEATKMSAGGDKPKSISSIKSTEYPYPIYSNGLDNEGLYGYTNEAKIFDESVTVSARGTIGFVCLRHIPYVPIVRLVTLIPDENMISAKYLYLYLKQLHISGTGTTQQQLTVPDFCKTEILIPDKTTMDKFTNLISPMFNRIWTNKEENIKLASLRDNLLPKLMSGEINVSDIQLYYFNSCL